MKIAMGLWENPRISRLNHRITEYCASYSCPGATKYVVGSDIDKLMQECARHADFAFIQAPGHLVYEGFEAILKQVLRNAGENWLVHGHILDEFQRQIERYPNRTPAPDPDSYSLFHEAFLVNLKVYRQLGCPAFGMPQKFTVTVEKPTRSAENIHDGYTPLYLEHSGEFAIIRPYLGWNFIDQSLKHGMKVSNFTDLRRVKQYLYPELQPQEAEQFVVKFAQDYIGRIWHTNNEPRATVGKQIDVLYSVASGLKPQVILDASGFHAGTQVVFVDYCQDSLDWRKKMVEEWDGYDYPAFVGTGEKHQKHYGNPADGYWEGLLKYFGGQHKFSEHWQRFKSLQFEYILCDLLEPEQQSKIVQRIQRGKSNYFWCSNAFYSLYSYVRTNRKTCFYLWNQWLINLRGMDPNIVIDAEPPPTWIALE